MSNSNYRIFINLDQPLSCDQIKLFPFPVSVGSLQYTSTEEYDLIEAQTLAKKLKVVLFDLECYGEVNLIEQVEYAVVFNPYSPSDSEKFDAGYSLYCNASGLKHEKIEDSSSFKIYVDDPSDARELIEEFKSWCFDERIRGYFECFC